MNGFILESETRGILVEKPGDRDEKYHFSPTKLRGEALVFETLALARHHREVLDRLFGIEVYVLTRRDWERVIA